MPEEFRFTKELTHVDSGRLGIAEKRDIEGLYRTKEYLDAKLRDQVVELEVERDLLSSRLDRLTRERDTLRERLTALEVKRPRLDPDRLVVSLGDALSEAQSGLAAANYTVGKLDVELKANVISTAEGVTLQLPDLAEPVERETLSTIRFDLRTTETGEELLELQSVPDLRGHSRPTAEAMLDRAGFVVGEVTTELGTVDDVIVSQFPSPHTVAEPSAAVDITVSERREREVPAVVGHHYEEAVSVLRGAALAVDLEHQQAVEPAGTVVGQDPPAGASVVEESLVTLTVSVGSSETATEDADTDATDGADGSVVRSRDDATDELQAVTVVDGIGPTYAGRLREAGIDSVRALAEADAETVAKVTDTSPKRTEQWLEEARALVRNR